MVLKLQGSGITKFKLYLLVNPFFWERVFLVTNLATSVVPHKALEAIDDRKLAKASGKEKLVVA